MPGDFLDCGHGFDFHTPRLAARARQLITPGCDATISNLPAASERTSAGRLAAGTASSSECYRCPGLESIRHENGIYGPPRD